MLREYCVVMNISRSILSAKVGAQGSGREKASPRHIPKFGHDKQSKDAQKQHTHIRGNRASESKENQLKINLLMRLRIANKSEDHIWKLKVKPTARSLIRK